MLKVKKAIIHRLIIRKSRERGTGTPPAKSDKLLFLFAVRDAAELNYYQNTLKLIEKYITVYDVLIFAVEDMLRKLPVNHPNHFLIFPKDLIKMLELPNKEMEEKLGRTSYKAVVNTFREDMPVLDFAAAAIPSKVRMTRFKESTLPAYNFRIEYNNIDDDNEFIQHTIEYLNKIK